MSSPVTNLSDSLVNSAVSEGAAALYPPLVKIVMGYLFPEPEGWITEWTGPHGYDVIQDAVTKADLPLSYDQVSLVLEYLKKSDIFGLAKLEKIAEGRAPLLEYFRRCKDENPFPLEIDDEMQADLSEKFDEELLRPFPGIKKMTELYSFYWCPAGMTVTIAGALGSIRSSAFNSFQTLTALRDHRHTSTQMDCWIQFPNDVLARQKTVQEQKAFMPPSFEYPRILDVVFCVLVKFLCTGETILPYFPATYTFCQEKTDHRNVIVGAMDARGNLRAHICHVKQGQEYGVAPLRKLVMTN